MSIKQPKRKPKGKGKKYLYPMLECDIPWCNRNNNTSLCPLPLFGDVLKVCWSHREIYNDNSQTLLRRLVENNNPRDMV